VTSPTTRFSPLPCARIAGALYALIIVCGIASEVFIRGDLISTGDAAATAASITAHRGLFRLGFLADSVMLLSDVGLAALLFVLFRPVSFSVALMALCFRLTQTAVIATSLLNYHTASLVLDGAGHAPAFNPQQVQALAWLYLDRHAHGYDLGLLFFGVQCILLGYLINKSRFLPRTLGWLMMAGGITYLAGSYIRFLLPHYTDVFAPLYAVALVAELSLCLWLLTRGVDAERWREQSAASSLRVM
jgi:hypothetical protein